MKARTLFLVLWATLACLLAAPVVAQESSSSTIYFYQNGQAIPVARRMLQSGDAQSDAEALINALLDGPTPDEQANNILSPLPAGTRLVALTAVENEATIDLRIPLDYLYQDLDAYLCDAIVVQIAKSLDSLDLNHTHVRVENETGDLVPISDFLPRPEFVPPTIPPNEDTPSGQPTGNQSTAAPEYAGQPPAPGQGQPSGALSGKTVWLSAGHGWYWSELLNRWNSQRPNTYGIVEDFANAEAVNYYLARYLWNAGADVWLVRERSMITHEIIVDNDDGSPAYTETGPWDTSSSAGYDSGSYRFTTAKNGTAKATWTPSLPQAGTYAVWAWYRHGENRPSDVTYQIRHAGGTTEIHLSQEVHGQTWRYLGEYYFEAGSSGRVTLSNESTESGEVVVADAVRFGGGMGSIVAPGGTSGEPRWEEAALPWIQYQGAPSWIYEDDASDVTARPFYAEWETAKGYPSEASNAVYVSWHTNAGGASGTNTYIHDTGLPADSAALQNWIHTELVSDLREAWDPAWLDRGQRSANLGELRELTSIPGVLLEVAFHDTEDPGDADDLREPVFRQIAARAVYQGIVKYFATHDHRTSLLMPEPPTRLTARSAGPSQITVSWAPPACCDGIVGDAATSYKVYQSTNGRGFDNGTETTDTSLTLSGFAPGALVFFRVTALNAGGESFPTSVVAVRTPAAGELPSTLIVDGFRRLDQSALIPQWESPALDTAQRMFLDRMNRYDYAIEHAQAWNACDVSFDGTTSKAVVDGDVELSDYIGVDWFAGEESSASSDGGVSLSTQARVLLSTYLDGGGRLLLSGSDIGYDLVAKGIDPGFYHDYLRAEYLGNDADTYEFVGTTGGPFAGLSGAFDDGTGDTYNVNAADYMAAANGSTVALSYSGGEGGAAVVAYAGQFRTIYLGFPLETVTDAATRTALFCSAADLLLPTPVPGVALTPARSAQAEPGQIAVYTHTLTNTGEGWDTYHITYHSSQGWRADYPPALTLGSGQTTTLDVSLFVPPEQAVGSIDSTDIMVTSRSDPSVSDTVRITTTVVPISSPRIINPGFEGGTGQTAWQTNTADSEQVFVHRNDAPPFVTPHGGDWLAWLENRDDLTAGITETLALTQVVALPSGEPTATLTLAWLGHSYGPTSAISDTLSVGLYNPAGALLTQVLTVTAETLTDTWQVEEFNLSAYAGQTVQLAFRAIASDTAYFVDDIGLTTYSHPAPAEFRAFWVDAYHDGIKSRKQVDELVETAQAGSFNALVVQVRRRGNTFYPSDLDPWASDANPSFDALDYLINRAHAANIQVHAWATTLAIWAGDSPPTAPSHTFNHHGPGTVGRDYWLMTSKSGIEKAGEQYYLDPGHPDVVQYTVDIYAELASRYDLDGLHLDRVRYPGRDWGYNPTSLARFQAQANHGGTPDPTDEEWLQWRRDQVTALVRAIYLTVTDINPVLRVSAAVSTSANAPISESGWLTSDPYRHHLQDWRTWLDEGILDLALPMIYRNHDEGSVQFGRWLEWAKEHQFNRGAVAGTGLYLNDVADSMTQWKLTREPSNQGNHPLGMIGYSYATASSEETSHRKFVNAAITELFTQTARPHTLAWKDQPSLGHLMGTAAPAPGCDSQQVDGHDLVLSGPESRNLVTDGRGWFGAVDLQPGEYMLSTEIMGKNTSFDQTVTIQAGAVSELSIILPLCPYQLHTYYIPVIVKLSRP